MRKTLACALAIFCAVPLGFAQTVHLKDGRAIEPPPGSGLRMSGSIVMVRQSGGEIGYAANTIEKIDFAKPPAIDEAKQLLAAGKATAALAKIQPTLDAQAPFEAIPGNWWADAALVRAAALAAANCSGDAQKILQQIADDRSRPEQARLARARLAYLTGKPGAAMAVYDAIIAGSADPATLAEAWYYKAGGHLALREFEPAALAYLRIPVFYPREKTLEAAAQLGCARAMVGLGDTAEAGRRLDLVIQSYPDSPEAGLAKAEKAKLNKTKTKP